MGTIDSTKSILTQYALDALCEKYHIPDTVHLELPGPNARIHNSPTEMDLFAFIYYVDPTKVKIGEREVREGEVSLLELTMGRVVPISSVNDQGNQNEVVEEAEDPNEKVLLMVRKFLLKKRRRKSDGASGSNHPLRKLMADHGTSGDVGASTCGKCLAAIQELFEQSTLNAEISVTAAVTVPFVTSFVTPTPERKGGRH
nr:hypothetical protein [Tanacetum cinerariifolium]